MVLQTLGKLIGKTIKVANGKAESFLNKGIAKLEAIEKGPTAEQVAAEAKRAKECVRARAEISSNTDLVIVVTRGKRSKRVVFRRNGKTHKRVLNALIEEAGEGGDYE